ncbi:MAG: hypothetical protein JWN08_3804, partial [Frankiales bacterium]|nr:hypothetical protein [Frankiales bacterium]
RDWLEDHGFTVQATTDWTLTATGPAHLLERRLPPALRGSVASAVRDSSRPVRSRSIPTGYAPEAVREAYAATAGGAGATVATIQFSGWRARDAQVFAGAAGIDLQPGQITSVPVTGARTDEPDGFGGDFEVALDVQGVLGAAPQARQLVFVAPNTAAGAIAAYEAVATRAERDGLTAVSVSWGACELDTAPALMASVELSLARMVAAGATVFAASGDAGAYGCAAEGAPDGRRSVDYPASSPSVLAVGGTTLRPDGAGWAETAWSDRSGSTSGYAGAGTGGGLSARFAAPPWQAGLGLDGRRGVPDLAAVADPRTGVGVYAPDTDGRRRWQSAGGTSLSAPLLAGQLASAVTGLGRTLGLGRLHVPFYASPRAFRDVVTGDNLRESARPGYDLATGLGSPRWAALSPLLLQPALLAPPATASRIVPVTTYAPVSPGAVYGLAESTDAACAGRGPLPTDLALADGPDRVATVVLAVTDGTGCRTSSRAVVLDRTPPATTAGLRPTRRPGVLALSWAGSDPTPSAGLATVTWRLRRTDTGEVVASGTAARSGSLLRSVAAGLAHRLEVEAVDRVGNTAAPAVSPDATA